MKLIDMYMYTYTKCKYIPTMNFLEPQVRRWCILYFVLYPYGMVVFKSTDLKITSAYLWKGGDILFFSRHIRKSFRSMPEKHTICSVFWGFVCLFLLSPVLKSQLLLPLLVAQCYALLDSNWVTGLPGAYLMVGLFLGVLLSKHNFICHWLTPTSFTLVAGYSNLLLCHTLTCWPSSIIGASKTNKPFLLKWMAASIYMHIIHVYMDWPFWPQVAPHYTQTYMT